MRPGPRVGVLSVILGLAWAAAYIAHGQTTNSIKPSAAENPLKELIPGRSFTPAAIAAKQADDFDNPAFPLVLEAEKLWTKPDGASGRSCNTCHAKASGAVQLNRTATSYPKYNEQLRKVITLEQRINLCRKQYMQAPLWAFESPELVGMTAYLKYLSRGSPYTVETGGPASPVFQAGRTIFEKRMGRLQLSCAQCHNERYGQKFSGETLSQGHPLDYPAFDESEGRVISLHERFRMCNALTRADPKPHGTEDYIALELYLAWRAKPLPIDAPGVRP